METALDSVSLVTIRRFASKSMRWIISYNTGLSAEELALTQKQYTSYRWDYRELNKRTFVDKLTNYHLKFSGQILILTGDPEKYSLITPSPTLATSIYFSLPVSTPYTSMQSITCYNALQNDLHTCWTMWYLRWSSHSAMYSW